LEDLVELVTLFSGSEDAFSGGAIDRLREHPWPGNVRELKQVIGTLLVLHAPRVITAQDVRDLLSSTRAECPLSFEARRLRDVLVQQGWDFELAGTVLGLSRSQVYRRAKRLGLRRPLDRGISRAASVERGRPMDVSREVTSELHLTVQRVKESEVPTADRTTI